MIVYKMFGEPKADEYADLHSCSSDAPQACIGIEFTVSGVSRCIRADDGIWDIDFSHEPSTMEIREALATLNNVSPEEIEIVPQTVRAV